jgi:gas vesicle protein
MLGKVEEGYGFKIYTLKDYKKSNDFNEVAYEVETPATLNYFKWVKKFVEDSQRPNPVLISELREQPLGELQEIPPAEENFIEESVKDHSTQIGQVIDGFRNGLSQLNEIVGETYDVQLNEWINDMTQGTLKGSDSIRSSLNQLKNTVSDGLKDVQKFINNTFVNISELFKTNITEYIINRVEGQVELKNEISTILDDTIRASLEKISTNIKNSLMANQTIKLNQIVTESENNIKNLKDDLGRHIEEVAAPFNTQIVENFETLDTEFNPIKESYSEIQILLEKLQKIITEFKNLA